MRKLLLLFDALQCCFVPVFIAIIFSSCEKEVEPYVRQQPFRVSNPTGINIILILGDDIGYEVLSCNGGQSYTTPNLDMMAQQGMRFTQCHGSPLCSPSRFMFLTGKYNFRNYTEWGVLDINQKTFANMLHDAGYKTACYGKWQLGGGDISIRSFGFDTYCVWNALTPDEKESRYKNPNIYQNGAFVSNNLTAGKYGEDIFTDSVLNFIDSNQANTFFVYYPMVLGHEPFCPTPDDPEFHSWSGESDASFFPSMVKYMDKKIGTIINKVKSLGIENKTMIIYVGDNGTTSEIISVFNNIQVKGGKGETTEYGTHVPLIAYCPGVISPGTVNDDLIDFTDFLPTLAGIAGISTPATYGPLDGFDFSPRLSGFPGAPRDWIFCHFNPLQSDDNGRRLRRFVQNKTYKLYDFSGEFYNIQTDINEQNPLPPFFLEPEEFITKAKFSNILASMRN